MIGGEGEVCPTRLGNTSWPLCERPLEEAHCENKLNRKFPTGQAGDYCKSLKDLQVALYF